MLGAHAFGLWITNLHWRTSSSEQRPGLQEASIMRVRGITNLWRSSIITCLVAVSDGHELGHHIAPETLSTMAANARSANVRKGSIPDSRPLVASLGGTLPLSPVVQTHASIAISRWAPVPQKSRPRPPGSHSPVGALLR